MSKEQLIEDQSSFSASMRLPATRPKQLPGRLVQSSAGFTFIELLMACAIIAVLAVMTIPVYTAFINHAKSTRAKQEIRMIEMEINAYLFENNRLPDSLNVAGMNNRGNLKDPWGHGYVYNKVATRNLFLNFLNTDYDIFCMGADGATPVGGAVSGTGADDLVRGADGAWMGYGKDW